MTGTVPEPIAADKGHLARISVELIERLGGDDGYLGTLGYEPVLKRAWGGFAATCMVLAAMSVLTSIASSFDVGLIYGGPVVIIWGWVAVSACVLCVALGMAELASSMPTSGGMYYWTFRLAGPKYGPVFSWVAGWVNVLAQVSGNAGQGVLLADLTVVYLNMIYATMGLEPLEFNQVAVFGIFCGWMLVSAIANSVGNTANIWMTCFGGVLNLAGAALLAIVVPLVATETQPASWVFFHFNEDSMADLGIDNWLYLALLGLLLPAWSYTGLDGASYMSEETTNASVHQPRAFLWGFASMAFLGFGMCLGLLFGMPSIEAVTDPYSESTGYSLAQVLFDVFEARTGSPVWGLVLFAIPFLGVFTCHMSCMTYTARILFAHSRDGLMLFSSWLAVFNHRVKTPVNAVWGVLVLDILLGLPLLHSFVAFESLISLSTIALYIIYVVPILLRITIGRKYFTPGPFSLGVWAYPCGVVSTIWMISSTVIFCLPLEYPVTAQNFNYASVALGGTILLSYAIYACPGVGAYRWFRGPEFDPDEFERLVLLGRGKADVEVEAGTKTAFYELQQASLT